MATTSIQNSFNVGEISPKIWGRTDLAKLRNGSSTMRNFFVDYRGGAKTRAGTAYVGMCKQGAPNAGGVGSINNPPRDINFQFNIYQGFELEFGQFYMRVKSQGAYVTETGKNITLITQADPAILQIIGHGFSVGDWVFISGVTGMTNFNGLTWVVSNVIDVNNINVTDLFGNPVDSTLFSAYVSGGTAARIYTVVSPYGAADLPYLKYTQSANVMTFCLVNQQTLKEYNIYDLQRFGSTNWQFGAVTFASSIGPPTNIKVTALSSTTPDTNYGYVVTAVDAITGEESVASSVGAVENNNISIDAGSNTISWNAVTGAGQYNVYQTTPTLAPGDVSNPSLPFGFIGETVGTNFTDSNITADFTLTPPLHNDPFAVSGISGGLVTNGGNGNYTSSNIGYQINTTTGSGAVLQLTLNNGFLAGIFAASQGQNYNPLTDTITITSGGVNPPAQATGSYSFISGLNPTVGQTISLNGVTITFVSGMGNGTNQSTIGGSLSATLSILQSFLTNTNNAPLKTASYSITGAVLNITYKSTGTAGNFYALGVGTYNGAISGATLTGGNDGGGTGGMGATATLTFTQPSGNTPSTLAYYQDRRGYANTLNQPDTYFFSKPGAFENMDSAIPTIDSDAIVGTPWAQQINGIQWMVPMQIGLIMLTGNSIWLLNGGNSAALTPASQTVVTQVYNGCSSTVPPLLIDNSILYVESKNSIVRDLLYNFIQGNYSGTDRTILSSHLFDNYAIVQWCYSQEPNKTIWAVRNDGVVLSFTVLREQDVFGWARHDTNGIFMGVSTITERPMAESNNPSQLGPLTDAVYFIVKRFVNGQWVYYSERMDDRVWPMAEDCWCVDAGIGNAQNYPQAILSAAASTGTGVAFTASASVFTVANVGDVIRSGGGIATVTSYVSGVQVLATITTPITYTVPNDPSNTPVAVGIGGWTITTPILTLTNLNHLDGLMVTGLADGNVITPVTVVNNSITLPFPASRIVVGLAFLPQLQTVYLDPPSQTGTTQTKRKTVNSVGVRMESTRGISIGTNQPDTSVQPDNATVSWSGLIEIKQAANPATPGNAIPLFTGDYFMNVDSGWDEHGQVALQQNYPLGANINGIITYYNLGDT